MKIFTQIMMLLVVCTLFPVMTGAAEKDPGSFSGLHQSLQYRISADMGQDNPAYYFLRENEGYRATNAPNGITIRINQSEVNFEAGSYSWGLKLRDAGVSELFLPRTGIFETAKNNRNRLEFDNYRGITSWYVNGPGGFQQGWTISKPASENGGQLSLSLDLIGNLNPVLTDDGTGIMLKDDNGLSILSYCGLMAYDAVNRSLPVSFELQGQALLIKVDDRGAQYPVVVDPWVQAVKLHHSDMYTNDYNGFSVAASADGSTVVTGAYFADFNGDPPISNAGAAYVFVKPANGWIYASQTAKLSASDKAANDWFGTKVSVSADGSAIAVTAYGSDPGGISGAGALYVFEKPAGGWVDATQTAKLTASDKAASDGLGWSVAISPDGSLVAGGAVNSDHRDVTATAGGVYVFQKPAGTWADCNETAKLIATVKDPGDKLGQSVAMSADGSALVAGAYVAHTSGGSAVGAMYLFEKPVSGWTGGAANPINQKAILIASDRIATDNYGYSVDISDDGLVAAAGNYKADIAGAGDAGAVYVFTKPAGGWADAVQTAKLTASDKAVSDWLGYTVSMNSTGSVIAAGSYKSDVDAVVDAGAVYIFAKPAGGWADGNEAAKLSAPDKAAADFFGNTVSITPDGKTIAIGASNVSYGAIARAGAAYVYLNDAFTGIRDTGTESYSLYPNPASGFVYIRGLRVNEFRVKIYNVLGSKVDERIVVDGRMDIRDLKPGMYFLGIEGKTLKFVKE